MDEEQRYFHVTFGDFDEQELDLGEVWESVYYHPELDKDEEELSAPEFPKVGSMILFAAQQRPRIGKVVEIQPNALRSVVVHMWKHYRASKDFVSAKFKPAESEGEPDQRAITVTQVKMPGIVMTDSNYMAARSRKQASKILKQWLKR